MQFLRRRARSQASAAVDTTVPPASLAPHAIRVPEEITTAFAAQMWERRLLWDSNMEPYAAISNDSLREGLTNAKGPARNELLFLAGRTLETHFWSSIPTDQLIAAHLNVVSEILPRALRDLETARFSKYVAPGSEDGWGPEDATLAALLQGDPTAVPPSVRYGDIRPQGKSERDAFLDELRFQIAMSSSHEGTAAIRHSASVAAMVATLTPDDVRRLVVPAAPPEGPAAERRDAFMDGGQREVLTSVHHQGWRWLANVMAEYPSAGRAYMRSPAFQESLIAESLDESGIGVIQRRGQELGQIAAPTLEIAPSRSVHQTYQTIA